MEKFNKWIFCEYCDSYPINFEGTLFETMLFDFSWILQNEYTYNIDFSS